MPDLLAFREVVSAGNRGLQQIRSEHTTIIRRKRIKSISIEVLRRSLEKERSEYTDLEKLEKSALAESQAFEGRKLSQLPVELITNIFRLSVAEDCPASQFPEALRNMADDPQLSPQWRRAINAAFPLHIKPREKTEDAQPPSLTLIQPLYDRILLADPAKIVVNIVGVNEHAYSPTWHWRSIIATALEFRHRWSRLAITSHDAHELAEMLRFSLRTLDNLVRVDVRFSGHLEWSNHEEVFPDPGDIAVLADLRECSSPLAFLPFFASAFDGLRHLDIFIPQANSQNFLSRVLPHTLSNLTSLTVACIRMGEVFQREYPSDRLINLPALKSLHMRLPTVLSRRLIKCLDCPSLTTIVLWTGPPFRPNTLTGAGAGVANMRSLLYYLNDYHHHLTSLEFDWVSYIWTEICGRLRCLTSPQLAQPLVDLLACEQPGKGWLFPYLRALCLLCVLQTECVFALSIAASRLTSEEVMPLESLDLYLKDSRDKGDFANLQALEYVVPKVTIHEDWEGTFRGEAPF